MPQTDTGKTYLPASTYDLLNRILRLGFPAFATLYLGLDALWDLPAEKQVVGTVALLAVFLGVILNISSTRYANNPEGEMLVAVNPDGTIQPSLSLNKTPEELANLDQVRFKVTTAAVDVPDFVHGPVPPVDDPNV